MNVSSSQVADAVVALPLSLSEDPSVDMLPLPELVPASVVPGAELELEVVDEPVSSCDAAVVDAVALVLEDSPSHTNPAVTSSQRNCC